MKNPSMVMVIELKSDHLAMIRELSRELVARKRRDRVLIALGVLITGLDLALITILVRGLS